MKCLIVEDDFRARKLLQIHLSKYFDCFIAVDGDEAVEAFAEELVKGQPYDLICLDIMMPRMNGHEALKLIREAEQVKGIGGLDCTKIIMTTALGESKDVIGAFREGCEAYIVKPIRKAKLLREVEKLGLISAVNI